MAAQGNPASRLQLADETSSAGAGRLGQRPFPRLDRAQLASRSHPPGGRIGIHRRVARRRRGGQDPDQQGGADLHRPGELLRSPDPSHRRPDRIPLPLLRGDPPDQPLPGLASSGRRAWVRARAPFGGRHRVAAGRLQSSGGLGSPGSVGAAPRRLRAGAHHRHHRLLAVLGVPRGGAGPRRGAASQRGGREARHRDGASRAPRPIEGRVRRFRQPRAANSSRRGDGFRRDPP